MASEEAARRTIEGALGRPVVLHDDGRQPGMYDLRIGPLDTPDIAVEVVGAVDARFAETWNVGPARGPLRLDLKGDWIITPGRNASVRAIKQHVEPILRELEEQGRFKIHVDEDLAWEDNRVFQMFDSLKIAYAACYNPMGSGRVDMVMEGTGGLIDEEGNRVAQWLDTFLRAPQQADVLSKLTKSRAVEGHVFVPVYPRGAPWEIESYLMSDLDQLPTVAPNLPVPVTGVWLVSTQSYSGCGVRWDGTMWTFFNVPDAVVR